MAAPGFPPALDSSSPDATAGAPPGDDLQSDDPNALAEDTQKPQFDIPDEALEQYGLAQAQVGDQVTATVTFTIQAKTPGSAGVGDEAGGGSTTLAVESVDDVQDAADDQDQDMSDSPDGQGGADGDSATSPKDPAALQDEAGGPIPASGAASALGFDTKKASRNKAISPSQAGFPTSKK